MTAEVEKSTCAKCGCLIYRATGSFWRHVEAANIANMNMDVPWHGAVPHEDGAGQ